MARAEEGEGSGRMPEPEAILAEVLRLLVPGRDLEGMKLVVSAGPTRERWDAVRYLSNRSSGKMGYALAAAAAKRGAEVTLVSGPVGLSGPPGLRTVRVESAAEMREAVLAAWKGAHAAIMAAAVADYRPARSTAHKQKKKEGPLSLKLERTADILAEMGKKKGKRLLVGFAAETEDLTKNAQGKLRRKGLDLIVANQVSGAEDAMGADAATAILIRAGGKEEALPRLRKDALASAILDRLAEMWQKVTPGK